MIIGDVQPFAGFSSPFPITTFHHQYSSVLSPRAGGGAELLACPLEQLLYQLVAGVSECGDRAARVGTRCRAFEHEDALRNERAVLKIHYARSSAHHHPARARSAECLTEILERHTHLIIRARAVIACHNAALRRGGKTPAQPLRKQGWRRRFPAALCVRLQSRRFLIGEAKDDAFPVEPGGGGDVGQQHDR